MRPLAGQRVLVTGGAGFIGSELVRQLASAQAEITVVDNLSNGKVENLAGLDPERVRFAVGDVRDLSLMSTLLTGMDIVFHLACLGVRHSIHSPHENHDVNATATLHLLSTARQSRVQRFIHVSSSEVYGDSLSVPMNEQNPTLPTTVYGSSKLAGEGYARAFHRTYGYPTVVVRPFNAYGPRCHHEGDSGEVIPKFMLRCMCGYPLVVFGDGTQTRDFTHVSDTARGILLAGATDAAVGQTINVGHGSEISINDLAEEIATVVGKRNVRIVHDEPRPGDVQRLCADNTRARELLGFEPTVSVRDGLQRLRDWYQELNQPPKVLLEQDRVRNWEPVGKESPCET